jgi:hypothetical protein
MEHNNWLRWIECHPGLAGYIQAAGVIVTVAIALLGPPTVMLFNSCRDWWNRRYDAIHAAYSARSGIEDLMQQIESRMETLPTVAPGRPWRGGIYGAMSIRVPYNLAPPSYPDYGRRLLFLYDLGRQAITYNEWLMSLTRNSDSNDEFETQCADIKRLLSDLRKRAILAREKIHRLKIYPWSGRNWQS